MVRSIVVVGLGLLVVAVLANGGGPALSSANSVPASALGQHNQLTVVRDFAPPECEANMTNAQLNSLVLVLAASGGATNDLILGTAGDDNFVGNNGADCMVGGDGADTLNGSGGADVVLGGPGDDPSLRGGGGNDEIFGGDGNDSLRGDAGTDLCDGGPGTDTAHGTCETNVSIP